MLIVNISPGPGYCSSIINAIDPKYAVRQIQFQNIFLFWVGGAIFVHECRTEFSCFLPLFSLDKKNKKRFDCVGARF